MRQLLLLDHSIVQLFFARSHEARVLSASIQVEGLGLYLQFCVEELFII